jgi:hypothetical protein
MTRRLWEVLRTTSLQTTYISNRRSSQDNRVKSRLLNSAFLALATLILRTQAAPPEPGPENDGLRLRLIVEPLSEPGKEGYEVQIDLLNNSEKAVTLRAKWRYDDEGDLKDYLEAATSIECIPAVAPWIGGVRQGHPESPQPERVLNAGEVLSVRWSTNGRRLKNRVTNPNEVQNPEFPFPGLYSVHATLKVITTERTVLLRSNEQLVSVGGSHEMPKYTFGRLIHVDPDGKTAILGLGSLHKIELGDEFEIGNAKGGHWMLTITRVEPELSFGDVKILQQLNPDAYPGPPVRQMEATLMSPKKH